MTLGLSSTTTTFSATAFTDSEGRYEFSVPPGDYIVGVFPEPETWLVSVYYPSTTFIGAAAPIPSGSSGIDFDLEKGGALNFGVVYENDVPLDREVEVTIFEFHGDLDWEHVVNGMTMSGGTFEYVLPEGTYMAYVNSPDESRYPNPQGLCHQLYFGERFDIERGKVYDFGTCELFGNRSNGYLYTFDVNWAPAVTHEPGGWVWGDFGDLNDDGLIDIVSSWGDAYESDKIGFLVLLNQGSNTFADVTLEWLPAEVLSGKLQGGGRDLAIGDLNCDGFSELVVGKAPESSTAGWGHKDLVFENVNGTHFVDRSDDWMPIDDAAALGFEDDLAASFSHCLELADFNNDGAIDIYRSNYYDQFLVNDGTGHMYLPPLSKDPIGDVARIVALGGHGAELGDLNGDGVVDLFVASPYESQDGSYSYFNVALGRGDGSFESIPEAEAPRSLVPLASGYDAVIADFDGNGLPGVYVAHPNSSDTWAPKDELLEVVGVSGGDPVFEHRTYLIINQSEEFNSSTRAQGADFDNDGDIDVLLGNIAEGRDQWTRPEIRIMVNDGSGSFEMLDLGAYPPVHVSPGGVLAFDSDNDGDLDLHPTNQWEPLVLFVNQLLEKHDFDGDGYVKINDAERVLSQFGSVGDDLSEDLNEDGVVDAKDLSLILRYQTTTRADNSILKPQCSQGGGR